MWLFYALLTPFFFGIVHVLDEHCLEEIFERPWFGVVTGAITSLVVYLALPFLAPTLHWVVPTQKILILALLAGVLIQVSVYLYFHALANTEAGIVAAYWNMVPALVPLLSYIYLGEILTIHKYLGIILLGSSSIIFCLIDVNLKTRWTSFLLMLAASLIQSIVFLIQNVVFESIPYSEGFYLITTGLIVAGLTPLLIKKNRIEMQKNSTVLFSFSFLLLTIELANLAALASSQRAVSLGIPSLVAAVESTIPAYTFILSVILFSMGSKYGNHKRRNHIPLKLTIVGIMILGVYLVS